MTLAQHTTCHCYVQGFLHRDYGFLGRVLYESLQRL